MAAGRDPLWTPLEARGALRPFIVRQEAKCVFRRWPDGRKRCRVCDVAKYDLSHLGAPPSFNAFGSGDPRAYQSIKQLWEQALVDLLTAARLPKPLGSVLVEGRVGFPDRIRRDQGNFRVVLEKALGDALQRGGWIPDDSWDRYEFGNLAREYDRGRSWTQLVLLPSWPDPPAQTSLLGG